MKTYVKVAGVLRALTQWVRASGGDVHRVAFRKPGSHNAPRLELLDYQTGDFTQWNDHQYNRPAQLSIVTSPARPGYTYSARFIVAPGDHTFGQTGAERGEVGASTSQTGDPAEGRTGWFAWSSYFPTGTHLANRTEWLAFVQWHHAANAGRPNIGLFLTLDDPIKVKLTVRAQTIDLVTGAVGYEKDWVLGLLPLGRWVDFAVGVKWSSDPALGHLAVKMDGIIVADVVCPTLYVGYTDVFKQGIYRANSLQTQTIYHTATRRGPTEASVAL